MGRVDFTTITLSEHTNNTNLAVNIPRREQLLIRIREITAQDQLVNVPGGPQPDIAPGGPLPKDESDGGGQADTPHQAFLERRLEHCLR